MQPSNVTDRDSISKPSETSNWIDLKKKWYNEAISICEVVGEQKPIHNGYSYALLFISTLVAVFSCAAIAPE